MGVDKRGKDRGGCGECDCSDYEQPPGYGSSRCSYCDCPPTRHEVGSGLRVYFVFGWVM